jgi:hypothetical protein
MLFTGHPLGCTPMPGPPSTRGFAPAPVSTVAASAPSSAAPVAPAQSDAGPSSAPPAAWARLSYVDTSSKAWLVSFDPSLQEQDRRVIATLDDIGAASRLTWTGDGRYLAWRETALHTGSQTLVIYDSVVGETWSVPLRRDYPFMGPANHGFVFYGRGPALFLPRNESGAHEQQVPEPRPLRPPLAPAKTSLCPPNPIASWHDRVFLADAEAPSMYCGPQQLHLVGLRGDRVRVYDDTAPGPGEITNFPMTAMVPDSSGNFVAYFTGATAGRALADYWILKVLDTHSWRMVGLHKAGCWEDSSVKGECTGETPSWLASAGPGAFLFIKSKKGEPGEVHLVRGGDLRKLGFRAHEAGGNDRAALLLVQPDPEDKITRVLSVVREGALQPIARHVEAALWAPSLRADDEPARRLAAEHLDGSDRDYADPQRGLGWGNRCFAHLKAKRMDAARAACEMGLLLQPKAEIEGALEYNLALIEEGAGNTARACAHLTRSLSVRPKNSTTSAKARSLGCEK